MESRRHFLKNASVVAGAMVLPAKQFLAGALSPVAGETAAADKARKRLTQLDEEGVALPPVEMSAESAPQASNLPPGFAPKKL